MSLLIAFSEEERHSRVRCCVLSRLQALGLDVLQDPTSLHHIQVTCTDSSLLDREADRLRLLKYNTKGLLQEFEVGISRDEFKCDEKTGDLFSVSQRNFLLLSVIEQLTVDKAFLADVHREVSPKAVEEEGVEEGAELLESCLSLGIVESFFPPQPLATQHQQLFTQAIRSWPSDTQVITNIYDQMGSEAALYQSFMRHLTLWLLPPAALGMVISGVNYLDPNMDVNSNPTVPLFSVFVIAWAVLFVQYFRRSCSSLACEWGLLRGGGARGVISKVRSDFRGEVVVSRVTGRSQVVFEWYRRLPAYFLSGVVTGLMLLVAFSVMVVSLNLQGYIHERAMGASLLHLPVVSCYSEPGALFDNLGGGPFPVVLPYVPVVLHAVVIMLLNTLYRHIAQRLTQWENHRTHTDFNNSLLLKRIFFEAFDCYIALFYLAFCQFDIVALRAELFGLFTADSVRRLVTETVLPYLLHRWEGGSGAVVGGSADKENDKDNDNDKKSEHGGGKGSKKKGKKSKKNKSVKCCDDIDSSHAIDTPIVHTSLFDPPTKILEMAESVSKQFILDDYENFDDYLEMVISFGYITLFASAFPPASALTLLCVILETKSDIFKLFWVSRMPVPRPTVDIGTWITILTALAWLSVVTNVFLFAFTTEQMMQIAEADSVLGEDVGCMASGDISCSGGLDTEDRQHAMVAGKQGLVWGYCFIFEHVLLLLAGLVTVMVPERPLWVSEELQRQEYVKSQEARLLHELTHGNKRKSD